MCRMVALQSRGPHPVEVLEAFRSQAELGQIPLDGPPGHRDGWGIVAYAAGQPFYAGREPRDATRDPAYLTALETLRRTPHRGVAIAHVRKSSKGAHMVENTHPFVHGRWSFAHNGTVSGSFGPPNWPYRGETDSERLFARLLSRIGAGAAPGETIVQTCEELARTHPFSSMTLLLSDGVDLWGYRRVGRPELAYYYTLNLGRLGDSVILSQETSYLPQVRRWAALADLMLVRVGPDLCVELSMPGEE